MSTNRVVGDALWRALCPSVDAKFLSKAIESPLLLTHSRPSHARARQCPHGSNRKHARAMHTSSSLSLQAAPRQAPPPDAVSKQPPSQMPSGKGHTTRSPPTSPSSQRNHAGPGPGPGPGPRKGGNEPVTAADLLDLSSSTPFPAKTLRAKTSVIYEALRAMRGGRKALAPRIRSLVEYLVRTRGERPNLLLYEALVTANWDPTTGSAGELSAILKEMKKEGIEPSEGFYHCALKLLSVHPDYLTRITILQEMKERGMQLADEGRFSVALAMLREGQYEMAMEYLDDMWLKGIQVPGWVLDIFYYVLAKHGFLDEALHLLQQRVNRADGDVTALPIGIWHSLLDECTRSLHQEGTRFAWEKMVRPGTLNPSDGVALGVLNTAARHGDPALATEVIQLLAGRRIKLGPHHYEALLDSYVQAGDLENAFRVLCIMAEAGVQPDQSSTRSIFLVLRDTPERADEIVGMLSNLSEQHAVPVAAINVLLEALAKTGDMGRTLEVYRRVHRLCASGPNRQTFLLLLENCENAETAGFLASEMHRYSVRSSPMILDNLIRCFAYDGPLSAVLGYLLELTHSVSARSWVSKDTLMCVLERCYREKDRRAWAIMAEAERRGVMVPGEMRRKLVELAKELEQTENSDGGTQPARGGQ
ncbi:hypothetical protein VTK26DRAFT_807 [Humicola hyalothermophila]